MTFEDKLGVGLYSRDFEKTYIDKLLGRHEVEKMKELIKKPDLNRSELLDLLYMLISVEVKLSNLNEWDRYLLGKYFTWVRDLVKLAEFLFDYQDDIKKYKFKKYEDEILTTIESIRKMLLHNVKFAVDVFLYLTRSTLGIEGVAFDTLSKGRFEYQYDYPFGAQYGAVQPMQQMPMSKRFGR